MRERSIWAGIRNGVAGRCPNCGRGRLFGRFLKPNPACEVCGADNTIYPADDMPPYLTILLVGHVVVPLFMWSDHALAPAAWLQFTVWPALTGLLCLLLLQPVKGGVLGLCWATNLVRPSSAS